MTKSFQLIVLLALVLLASCLGVILGQKYMHEGAHPHSESPEWHMVLHHKLSITSEQEAKLHPLEDEYARKKKKLKEEMRLANMQLADALKKDQAYSSQVQASVDKIHQVMGEMQKQTIKHLLEMRPILDDEQNKKLEQLITNALYENTNNSGQ